MASDAQRYAVGIGTGAASGAALGTSILPGWGTAIGGVLGAGAGAIGAAMGNSDAAKQQALIDEQRKRERKQIVLELLRNQAVKNGYDPAFLDTVIAEKGLDRKNALEDRALANANRLDANSFVPMAQAGVGIAKGLYGAFNTPSAGNVPSGPLQLQPAQGSLLDDNYASRPSLWQNATSASLIGEPDLIGGTPTEYDPNAPPQWARRLQL